MEETEIAWRPSEMMRRNANWSHFIRPLSASKITPRWRHKRRPSPNGTGVPWPTGSASASAARRTRCWTSPRPAHPGWCLGGTANLVDTAVTGDVGTDAGPRCDHLGGRRWRGAAAELCRHWSRKPRALAAGLQGLGLVAGDVVGFYLPMLPETAVAFMACARIGCITLPLFSGFGADAVAQRLALSGARAVITADATRRRGQTVTMKPVVDTALRDNADVRHVVVLRQHGVAVPMQAPRDVFWHELTAAAGAAPPIRGIAGGTPDAADVHLRHHRPAQGHGAYPRRARHQDRPGCAADARPQARRPDVVADRFRLVRRHRHHPRLPAGRRHAGHRGRRARPIPIPGGCGA